MNKFWLTGAVLVMTAGGAMAQTSTSQTTTTVYPTVGTPVPGSVSTTRTDDTTNADGTVTVSKETTFHNPNGVADDSVTKTTTYPGVAVTTTQTKTTTTTTQ